MHARSAILVAVVAVLAGGAFWLVRGLDGRAQGNASTVDETASQSHAEGRNVHEPQLAPAPSSIETARATIGESRARPSAAQKQASPTRLNVLVVRSAPRSVPVPNARVQIVDTALANGRPGWTVLAEGDTNASGLFSFDAPRSFRATVRAEASVDGKHLFGVSGGMVQEASETRFEIGLADEPPTETQVTVIDRDTLLPIAGADVRPSNGAEPTTTNGLGQFSVASANGQLCAWIGATGYFPVDWCNWDPRLKDRAWRDWLAKDARAAIEPLPTPPKRSSMFLHRSARLTGSVVDARGRVIEGVRLKTRVRLSSDMAYEPRDVVAETDDHGRFAFEALPAGLALLFELTARGETVRADVDAFELEPGETRTVTLRIRGHVELSGRVLDAKDELVKAGSIEVSIDGHKDASRIRPDGTYYLPFAVAGSGWIAVTPDGEAEEQVEPVRIPVAIPFDVTEWTCDVRLVPATSIAGVFLDAENRPVHGVLTLMRGATQVDDTSVQSERGEFRFEAVPLGDYTVRAVEKTGAQRSVQIPVHAGDQNVMVRLPPQGVVAGRVVDAGGMAVSGARVTIAASEGFALELESAHDGGFRSPSRIGMVWVSAGKGDLHTLVARVAVGVEGESTVPDLVLAPSAPLRFMAGRLGAPAQVEVSSDAGLCFSGPLESYADRTIRVPLGTLRVVVTCAGKPPETRAIEVRAGETAVVPIAGVP